MAVFNVMARHAESRGFILLQGGYTAAAIVEFEASRDHYLTADDDENAGTLQDMVIDCTNMLNAEQMMQVAA